MPFVFGNGRALADALHHRGAPCLHSSVRKRFAGFRPEGGRLLHADWEGLRFRFNGSLIAFTPLSDSRLFEGVPELCPLYILTRGDNFEPLHDAPDRLIDSLLAYL